MSRIRALTSRIRLLIAAAAIAALTATGLVVVAPTASAAGIIRANEEIAFNYFVGKGLTTIQAAGVIGNLDQESYMDPTIYQTGGGAGRGIAQWSAGGRWDTYNNDNVVQFANQRGVSPWGLQVQLDFIWYELTTFRYYGLAELKAATTIYRATVVFQDKFEGCGTCHTDRRVQYAVDAHELYA